MAKMDWSGARDRRLAYESRGIEREERVRFLKAVAKAREARKAAERSGVTQAERRGREKTCAWLDEVMKLHPDRPWLAV